MNQKNILIQIENQGKSDELVPVGQKADNPSAHPINIVLKDFLSNVRSIQMTRRVVLPHVFNWLKTQHETSAKKLAKYAARDESGESIYRAVSAHQASEMFRAIRDLDGLGGMKIAETLQRSLFTQLFSEYDAFVGALLKVIYTRKSDLLKNISRQISFVDLLSYEDLNAIKFDMLEKEVETFRRNSYVDQFSSLESKFGMKLKDFPEWGDFIELSQRRNLIVHNGGVVSDQYLLVCDKENYKFVDRPKIGESLKLNGEYFAQAIIVVSKVAFMLCHTLWRKLFPNEREIAHEGANAALYNILRENRWKTANAIAEFSLTSPMKEKISDMDLRIRTINCAIAAKFSENEVVCKKIIGSLDWSAALRDFKLAILVLSDKFSEAADLMISIGRRGEILDELSYHDWPLFYKFRESSEFLNAYEIIYNISFISESIRHKTEAVEATQAEFNNEEKKTGDLLNLNKSASKKRKPTPRKKVSQEQVFQNTADLPPKKTARKPSSKRTPRDI